jgi:hypothetical protein
MNRFFCKAALTTIVVLAIIGCATTPQITKSSPNYLQKGMVSAKLQGNDFYMAIGEVDLYHYGSFGGLEPSGQTVEISVVIQADKDTGEVLRIATMQSNKTAAGSSADFQNGVTVANGADYVIADLRGGISIIDIQPYPHWIDAIQSMRNAITELSTYTTFAGGDQSSPVVVAVAPVWPWWGWRNFWHRRYRY